MNTPAGRGTTAALFVWSVWAILLLADLGFVLQYGSNLPYWDDWDMVPHMTGAEAMSPGWLWAQHNEHRIPVPKLLFLGLYRAGGCDLRLCMAYSVLALGLTAAALLLAVRHRRGSTLALDALFPLVLLHLGQPHNLLWAFQVGFVTGTLLVGLLLALLILDPAGSSSTCLAGVAVLTLLLPLCGANSLAFVPGMVLWLGCVGFRRRGAWVAAALVLLLVGLYLVGWEAGEPGGRTGPRSTLAVLRVAAQFLSTAGGPAVGGLWPAAAAVVIGLSAGTVLLLARAARQTEHRLGALGLLGLLSGFVVLALGLGWGRARFGDWAGLANRYVTLAAPLVCLLYCAWEFYLPRAWALVGQALLFGVFALLLIPNTLDGLAQGRARRQVMLAAAQDARAGLEPLALARQYTPALCDRLAQEKAAAGLELLRGAGLEPYAEGDNP